MDVDSYVLKDQVRMNAGNKFTDMDLLPAHEDLVYLDMNIAMNNRANFQNGLINKEIYKYQYLNNILEPLHNDYDFMFIDCPPNIGYTTINALYASNYCLIPTNLDYLSSYGISSLLKEIERLNTEFSAAVPTHPSIEVVGIVANNVEERNGIPATSEQGRPIYHDEGNMTELWLRSGDICRLIGS